MTQENQNPKDETAAKAFTAAPCSVVLPCPICGEPPSVETFGTCIDIECCVSMSRQKCDYLTIEERGMFSDDMINYADEVEAKAYKAILSAWNTRTPQNAKT